MHGRGNVRDYMKNFNLMWQKPYSRDAYTTTYSSVGFNGFAPLREVHR